MTNEKRAVTIIVVLFLFLVVFPNINKAAACFLAYCAGAIIQAWVDRSE